MNKLILLITIIISIAAAGGVAAENYKIDWTALPGGGGSGSSTAYNLSCTIAQPAAAMGVTVDMLHWVGFWSGDMPEPRPVLNLMTAKMLEDDTFVSISGKIATSAAGDFNDFFYIEDANRTGGIRIAAPASAVSQLARGSMVNIIGSMGTSADDERQIVGPMVIVTAQTAPPSPFAMNNSAIGGGDVGELPLVQYGVWRWQLAMENAKRVRKWLPSPDLNNMGMLVKTWGKVIDTGDGYVSIDDGSGPVRVDTSTLVSKPQKGSFICVVGISSLYKHNTDHISRILPRADSDVSTH